MDSKNRYADLAIILSSTLALIILLNTVEYFLLLANVPHILMAVFIFPFAEEFYKYLFAKEMQRKAFIAILTFAIFEIFLVKIPLFYLNNNVLSWLFFLYIIPAFIFHISTALNYTNRQFLTNPLFVLCAMIVLHCLFNYLSYLIIDTIIFFVCAMLFAFTPWFWLFFSSRVLSRNADQQ